MKHEINLERIEDDRIAQMFPTIYTITVKLDAEGMAFAGIPSLDIRLRSICDSHSKAYNSLEDAAEHVGTLYKEIKSYLTDTYMLPDGFVYEYMTEEAFIDEALRVDDGAIVSIEPDLESERAFVSGSYVLPVLFVKVNEYKHHMITEITVDFDEAEEEELNGEKQR